MHCPHTPKRIRPSSRRTCSVSRRSSKGVLFDLEKSAKAADETGKETYREFHRLYLRYLVLEKDLYKNGFRPFWQQSGVRIWAQYKPHFDLEPDGVLDRKDRRRLKRAPLDTLESHLDAYRTELDEAYTEQIQSRLDALIALEEEINTALEDRPEIVAEETRSDWAKIRIAYGSRAAYAWSFLPTGSLKAYEIYRRDLGLPISYLYQLREGSTPEALKIVPPWETRFDTVMSKGGMDVEIAYDLISELLRGSRVTSAEAIQAYEILDQLDETDRKTFYEQYPDLTAKIEDNLPWEYLHQEDFGYQRGIMEADKEKIRTLLAAPESWNDSQLVVLLLSVVAQAEMEEEVADLVLSRVSDANLSLLARFGYSKSGFTRPPAVKSGTEYSRARLVSGYLFSKGLVESGSGRKRLRFALLLGRVLHEYGRLEALNLSQAQEFLGPGHIAGIRFAGSFKITDKTLKSLKRESVPDDVLNKLEGIKDHTVTGDQEFVELLRATIGDEQTDTYRSVILEHARLVAPKGERAGEAGSLDISVNLRTGVADIEAVSLPFESIDVQGADYLFRSDRGTIDGLDVNVTWPPTPDQDKDVNGVLTFKMGAFRMDNVRVVFEKDLYGFGNITLNGVTIRGQQNFGPLSTHRTGQDIILKIFDIGTKLSLLLTAAIQLSLHRFSDPKNTDKRKSLADDMAHLLANEFYENLQLTLSVDSLLISNFLDPSSGLIKSTGLGPSLELKVTAQSLPARLRAEAAAAVDPAEKAELEARARFEEARQEFYLQSKRELAEERAEKKPNEDRIAELENEISQYEMRTVFQFDLLARDVNLTDYDYVRKLVNDLVAGMAPGQNLEAVFSEGQVGALGYSTMFGPEGISTTALDIEDLYLPSIILPELRYSAKDRSTVIEGNDATLKDITADVTLQFSDDYAADSLFKSVSLKAFRIAELSARGLNVKVTVGGKVISLKLPMETIATLGDVHLEGLKLTRVPGSPGEEGQEAASGQWKWGPVEPGGEVTGGIESISRMRGQGAVAGVLSSLTVLDVERIGFAGREDGSISLTLVGPSLGLPGDLGDKLGFSGRTPDQITTGGLENKNVVGASQLLIEFDAEGRRTISAVDPYLRNILLTIHQDTRMEFDARIRGTLKIEEGSSEFGDGSTAPAWLFGSEQNLEITRLQLVSKPPELTPQTGPLSFDEYFVARGFQATVDQLQQIRDGSSFPPTRWNLNRAIEDIRVLARQTYEVYRISLQETPAAGLGIPDEYLKILEALDTSTGSIKLHMFDGDLTVPVVDGYVDLDGVIADFRPLVEAYVLSQDEAVFGQDMVQLAEEINNWFLVFGGWVPDYAENLVNAIAARNGIPELANLANMVLENNVRVDTAADPARLIVFSLNNDNSVNTDIDAAWLVMPLADAADVSAKGIRLSGLIEYYMTHIVPGSYSEVSELAATLDYAGFVQELRAAWDNSDSDRIQELVPAWLPVLLKSVVVPGFKFGIELDDVDMAMAETTINKILQDLGTKYGVGDIGRVEFNRNQAGQAMGSIRVTEVDESQARTGPIELPSFSYFYRDQVRVDLGKIGVDPLVFTFKNAEGNRELAAKPLLTIQGFKAAVRKN